MGIIKKSAVSRTLTTAELSTYVGSPNEFVKNSDTNGFVLMDGVTPGGLFEITDDNTLSMSEILSMLPGYDGNPPLTETEVIGIAQSASRDLEQTLLANDAQPAKTVLAVGYTNTKKVQGVSLGDGNVVTVYANGNDYINKVPLYTEFMALGEPICFTNVSNGAIITSTEGFYGASEQRLGTKEGPMPLLSLGLSFTETFFYAWRGSSSADGRIRVVCGALKSKVSLYDTNGQIVLGQENLEVDSWGYLVLSTDGNGEYRIVSNNKIMACIHSNMSFNTYFDSRLLMPLTNDGITWPRSGFISALYDNTKVEYYVQDGASSLNEELSLLATRPNVSGAQVGLDNIIDGKDTRARIAFTTPNTPPTTGNVKVIWESGGETTGTSMVIMPDWSIGLTWGSSSPTPKLTFGTLTPNTDYSFVIEFLFTASQIKVFYSNALDFTWFERTLNPQFSFGNIVGLDNLVGDGDFSLSGTDVDVGGLNPIPSNYAFDGVIQSDFTLHELDGTFLVSPEAPRDLDLLTGAVEGDYKPEAATRVIAQGLYTALAGSDLEGFEATPLMPSNAMSQVIAQPFNIADFAIGRNSSVAIASLYEGTAEIYEWDSTLGKAKLAYTLPLTRGNGQIVSRYDQYTPAAGVVSNDVASGAVELVGELKAGYIKADVPVTVVSQSGVVGSTQMRSQNGTTTVEIACDDDETLMLGHTPDELRCEIRTDSNGLLRKSVINTDGSVSWEIA